MRIETPERTPPDNSSSGLSEVEPGLAVPEPVGGHSMDVAFPHDDVVLAVHLDLCLVLGIEQDPVPDLD